jgi:hypothetical protein
MDAGGRDAIEVGLPRERLVVSEAPWARHQKGEAQLKRSTEEMGVKRLKRIAYSAREIHEMTGVSESGIRNLIRRGTLRAVQWDGRWLVPASVIEETFGPFDPTGREEAG